MWAGEVEGTLRIRARWLKKKYGTGTLLDVGCGAGDFLRAAADEGFQVTGSDFSTVAAARVRSEGIDVREGPFGSHQFKRAERFKIITLMHSLEHMPEPGEVLKQVFHLLDEGGVLLVDVPNRMSLRGRFPNPRRARLFDLPVHLFHFTPASLDALMLNAGFQSRQVRCSVPRFLDRVLGLQARMRCVPQTLRKARIREDRAPDSEFGESWSEDTSSASSSPGARVIEAARKWTPGWTLRGEGRKRGRPD